MCLRPSDKNHNYVINFPGHVDKYNREELQHNAILDLFDHLPVESHFCPFMRFYTFIFCDIAFAINSYQVLVPLLQDPGLAISDKKLTSPSTQVACLGIWLDIVARTISIPLEIVRNNISMSKLDLSNLLQETRTPVFVKTLA